MRIENDFLGELSLPEDVLYGIHTARALENFDISDYKTNIEFIKAFGLVKLACAQTINDLDIWDKQKAQSILQACEEMAQGCLIKHIVVDSLQGGAGTSLNMNINEVIANRALELSGRKKGDYAYIDPIEDINKFQSTNDVYPTALKIACIRLLKQLEKDVTALEEVFEQKEKEFADIVKVGRTQLQDAVLTTLGKEFSAYAEAISRDRWRIYKCEERLRVVNIGGTAIGTGVGAPRKYIFGVIEKLRELTGIGLSRAENPVDCTQNTDVFVEVNGILKAHASNLIKISNDLRLMSSGPRAGLAEITLPKRQAGSTIMAGKVNPVIPEMVAQVGIKVFGNDMVIGQCAAMGQLELNQFMPLIAFSLLETFEILSKANKIFNEKCVRDIKPNIDIIKAQVDNSYAVLTALLPSLGYNKIRDIIKNIENTEISPKSYILNNKILSEEEYNRLTSAESLLALGYRIIRQD